MKFIKKYYLLLLLIITLAGATIYGTYAMFTSSVETNMVNMDTYMNYTFDINGTQELKVSAGSKLRFNAIVKNSMDGKISYGMYYKMISPTTLPSGVVIAQVSDDLTVLAKGQLDSGTSKTVPIVIKNTSDSEITVEIGVRTGYATDSQGPDDIIYNEGEIPITSFQTSEEAGNDSCTATMECTTECTSRIENGKKLEVCYCYTGNELPMTVADVVEQIKATANTGTPDFSQVATTDEGVYAASDDYGTSYYFRGAVENNYVQFAGYYWRIIRTNGDGSIRMIYDGTSAYINGESSNDKYIATSVYNVSNDDNAYVGYMYGSNGASSYNETHMNTNNNTIKTIIDNWYKTNIVDKGYSDKVADIIYCNDRSVNTGNGYGTSVTYYSAYNRLNMNKNSILVCPQKNDAFTVNDTTKGNGVLTYPVGLITVDEVSMAGAVYSLENNKFYLYSGSSFWTMSPFSFSGGVVRIFDLNNLGSFGGRIISNASGVRPVISLKSSVILTGTGTMDDPYVLS